MNSVVIRVDASVWIGSGHVMRCLVLADSLNRFGYSVRFACLEQEGDMIGYIEQRCYKVIKLTPPDMFQIPKYSSDYEAWLHKSPLEDASDFLKSIKNTDLVITDHYGIGKSWHNIVKVELSCLIVAIDDLVREHNADLIIDQTLGRVADEYKTKGRVLSGTKYALINDSFAVARPQAEKRRFCLTKPKVMISMGGIDRPNATISVLKSLVGSVQAEFTILLSKRAPHYQEVTDWCSQYDDVHHHEFVEDMAAIMLEHDIAIGAPGSTSWERACLGLPSIIISLADNQREICKQLVHHGAVIEVKLDDIAEQISGAFNMISTNWTEFSRRNLFLCDGKGTARVTAEIMRLKNGNNHYLQ
jgi:UDP-2,4-diacetamido-2,4,6-trideoxy-beta-L-altropyranose hydrolase